MFLLGLLRCLFCIRSRADNVLPTSWGVVERLIFFWFFYVVCIRIIVAIHDDESARAYMLNDVEATLKSMAGWASWDGRLEG
jgi:hypothetical protein